MCVFNKVKQTNRSVFHFASILNELCPRVDGSISRLWSFVADW